MTVRGAPVEFRRVSDPSQPRSALPLPRRHLVPLLFLLAFAAYPAGELRAQNAAPADTFLWPGNAAVDHWRLAQIGAGSSRGAPAEPTGFLLRSPSRTARLGAALSPAPFMPSLAWAPLPVELTSVWNSDLPHTFNDGSLWAGRGLNLRLRGGVALEYGPVRLILAPELVHESNDDFQILPYHEPGGPERSRFADPFHPPPESIDQPLRFGDRPRTRLYPGQSSLTVDVGPVSAALATENHWWGPGVRNAIVLSGHAPGFPHLALSPRRPLDTPLGVVDARWLLGRLTESDFFDADEANDHNSLSGLAVTLAPAVVPDLTLGFTRVVYAPLDEGDAGLGAAFDVFRDVGRPNAVAEPPLEPGPDQIFSLFWRWIFPDAGFETWGEWARFEQPASLEDFLEVPNHSQGYTVGLQWAPSRLRVQAELTTLEPAPSFRIRRPFSSYTSRAVAQGYTHRGQVLGASIGPAASSQWLAADHVTSRWWAGGFAGRVRWEHNVFFGDEVPQPKREDITLFWGLRGGGEALGVRAAAEVATGFRINYLFQSRHPDPVTLTEDGVDLTNHTVSLTLSRPLGW